jgi:histidinol-phosphate aminotransferase
VRPEIERLAPYVGGESLDAFSARTGIPVERLIKLNSNENPYGPSPRVQAALGDYARYHRYPDPTSPALRAALAAYTGAPAETIFLSNGSNELIQLLWRVFLGPGESVALCPPTFTLYTTVTALCAGEVVEVPRAADGGVDAQAVRAALRPQTRVIMLCSPNNPTGEWMPLEIVEDLLDTGRLIVVDEAYIEFAGLHKSAARLVAEHNNLAVLRTFSKWAGLAGLRLGYGILPQWIIAHLRKVQPPFEVNAAAHIAALESLADLEHLQQNIKLLVAERERLYQLLSALPFLSVRPSETNFLLATLTDARIQARDLRATLEAAGILVRFYNLPGLERSCRISVGTPSHTDALLGALATLQPARV